MTGPLARLRVLALERVLLGTALVIQPARTISTVSGQSAPVGIARLLGARFLVQALVELARPRRDVARGAAVVDAVHAASMVAAAAMPAYRRIAVVSAVEATVTSVLTWVIAPALP